jgi:hypothetical protein
MKNKFLLPLLAVVFAVVGALATPLTGQMAWFKPVVGSAEQGIIDSPDTSDPSVRCTLSGETQCYIGSRKAYNSELGANTENEANLLKYD